MSSWSLIANNSGGNSGTPDSPVNVTIDSTGANLIIVSTGFYVAGQSSYNVVDNKSNTFTSINNFSPEGSSPGCDMFYCISPNVGSSHTIQFTTVGNPVYAAMAVDAWTGFDTGQTGPDTSNSAHTSGTFENTLLVPLVNDVLLMTMWVGDQSVVSVDNSFTILDNFAGFSGTAFPLATAYLIQSTPSNVSPGWTQSASGNLSVFGVGFKGTGGGGGATWPGYQAPFGWYHRKPQKNYWQRHNSGLYVPRH